MSEKGREEFNSSKKGDYQCKLCNKELSGEDIYCFGGQTICQSCMKKIILPIFIVFLVIVLIIILFNIL